MLKFRPHHFMCTLSFKGIGYSKRFVSNYKQIVSQLTADPDTLIQVTYKADDICSPCPHKQEDGLCASQEKIEKLDNAHAVVLRLQPGDVLSWREAKQKIYNHMTLEQFNNACSGCEWKALGVCEKALSNLLSGVNTKS